MMVLPPALVPLVGLALLMGCRTVPFDPGIPVADVSLARSLRENVESCYPSSLQAIHRVLLSAADTEFDLNGYLVVRKPREACLVAASNLGGTAFEVRRLRDCNIEVVRNTSGLDPLWIEAGAVRDLMVCYLKVPAAGAALVRHPDAGTYGLREDLPDGTREEYLFDESTRRWCGFSRFRGGNCLYQAVFSNEGTFPGWSQSVPRAIKITDHVLDYQLSIQVLDLQPTSLESDLFERRTRDEE